MLSLCARRGLLLLFCLLTASGIAHADGWAHHAALWSNSGGMSITIPGPFKVTDQGDVLSAETGDGAFLTVTAAHSKDDVQKVMGQANQVLKSYNVDLGASHDGKRNGVEVTYAEGKCLIHDVPIDVTLAVFNHGQQYLVCQLLVAKKQSPRYTPLMKKVFGSITGGK